MIDTEEPKALNPWIPESDPVVLAHLGKLGEELNECASAASRCVIQQVGESHPVTNKNNSDWLAEEMADVVAMIGLTRELLKVDPVKFDLRIAAKRQHLRRWFDLIRAHQRKP